MTELARRYITERGEWFGPRPYYRYPGLWTPRALRAVRDLRRRRRWSYRRIARELARRGLTLVPPPKPSVRRAALRGGAR